MDLGQNLGDIMKPSHPDFGYEDQITFGEEAKKGFKGWGVFLDVIKK